MPMYPFMRVTRQIPFQYTGTDYAGHFWVKLEDLPLSQTKLVKVWICILTCLCTRGTDLQVVEDYSAKEFIRAFRNFLAVRGTPIQILSDRASYYTAGSKTIDAAWAKVMVDKETQSYMSSKGIDALLP